MKELKRKILILGGYGNVGGNITKILSKKCDSPLVIAGRSIDKAKQFLKVNNISADVLSLDLNKIRAIKVDLSEVKLLINCIESDMSKYLVKMCGESGAHYTELATSFEAYKRLLHFDDLFKKNNACLVPGIGLSPGLSGIFVEHASQNIGKISSVENFTLLGLGEKHGLDAIRWMLSVCAKKYTVVIDGARLLVRPFSKGKRIVLQDERRKRKFFNYNMADQHIIQEVYEPETSITRLAFDSRITTLFFSFLRRIGLIKTISRANPIRAKKILDKFSFGSDTYAIQACCEGNKGKAVYLARGANEGFGTAVIASCLAEKLLKNSTLIGTVRAEKLISFEGVKNYLREFNIEVQHYIETN